MSTYQASGSIYPPQNNRFNPSAPPEDRDIPTVNWNKLPSSIQQPKWHQSTKMWNAVGGFFTGGGIGFGAVTAWASISFTAVPVVVLTVVSGLAILTLLLTITGIYLVTMKPSSDAPHELLKQRRAAGQAIDKGKGMGVTDILNQYNTLYKKGGITKEELNIVLARDLNLPLADFRKKHGDRVFDILDDQNKEILRKNYLNYVKENASTFKGLNSFVDYPALNLKKTDVAEWIIAAEIEQLGDNSIIYADFVTRNGKDAFQYVICNPVLKETLWNAFIQMNPSEIISEQYKNDRIFLDIDPKEYLNNLWKKLSFKEILSNYKDLFFQSLNNVFSPREWTYLALVDTKNLTIKALLTAGLFKSGIFQATDRINTEPTLAERLEKEIQSIETFQELVDSYSEDIFKFNLLTSNSPKLAALLIPFVKEHSDHYLGIKTDDNNQYIALIKKYNLLPQGNADLIEAHRAHLSKITQQHQEKLAEKVTSSDMLLRSHHQAIEDKYKINSKNDNYEKSKQNLEDLKVQAKVLERDIRHKEAKITRCNDRRIELQQQVGCNDGSDANRISDNLVRDIRRIDSQIASTENAIKNLNLLLSDDFEVKCLQAELKTLQEKRKTLISETLGLSRQIENQEKRLQLIRAEEEEKEKLSRINFSHEMSRIQSEIATLKTDIAADSSMRSKPVKGAKAALKAIKSTCTTSELDKKKNNLKQLEESLMQLRADQIKYNALCARSSLVEAENVQLTINEIKSKKKAKERECEHIKKKIQALKHNIHSRILCLNGELGLRRLPLTTELRNLKQEKEEKEKRMKELGNAVIIFADIKKELIGYKTACIQMLKALEMIRNSLKLATIQLESDQDILDAALIPANAEVDVCEQTIQKELEAFKRANAAAYDAECAKFKIQFADEVNLFHALTFS